MLTQEPEGMPKMATGLLLPLPGRPARVRNDMIRIIALVLVLGAGLHAQGPLERVWRWSLAAIVAANTADTASSIGAYETNPVLGRQVGPRFVAVKSGAILGTVGIQYWVLRKHTQAYHPFVYTNFVVAGTLTAISVRNFSVK